MVVQQERDGEPAKDNVLKWEKMCERRERFGLGATHLTPCSQGTLQRGEWAALGL